MKVELYKILTAIPPPPEALMDSRSNDSLCDGGEEHSCLTATLP